MEAILEATARDTFGKNEARRTRARGRVPAVVYGATARRQAESDADRGRAARRCCKILHSESGANTLISLKLAGAGDTRVLVKDYPARPGHARSCCTPTSTASRWTSVLQVTIPVVVQGRAEGRQAAGRHPRVHPPRDRDRVPAGRHSRARRGRRQRADAAPGRPRPRHRDQPEVEAGQRPRHDARARDHAEGRGSRGAGRSGGRGATATPAEPEVIKKGKKDEDEKDDKKKDEEEGRQEEDAAREGDRRARQSGPAVPGHAAQRRVRGRRRARAARQRSASSRRRPTR